MSDHSHNQYQNHQRAAELHNAAAHAHRVAIQHHDRNDHLSGQEHSRKAMEHSNQAFLQSERIHADFGHQRTSELAHKLWQARGCPEGSPDEDWFRANNQIQMQTKPPVGTEEC